MDHGRGDPVGRVGGVVVREITMNIITGGRGTGKTELIVKRFQRAMVMHSLGAHLLVATAARREEIISKYHLLPYMAQRVIVVHHDCLRGTMGQVFADDLDNVINMLLGRTPDYATTTGDWEGQTRRA